MIQPDASGLYHPRSDKEVVDLIRFAIRTKRQVRVRGAAQSPAAAVYADGYTPDKPSGKNLNLQLDRMRSVRINQKLMQVTVGAGCHLGEDPGDPQRVASGLKGLLYKLDQAGLALENVPDEIHQTVGGFISTGSSGGSMLHSFDECILSIRMVDGTGKLREFKRSDNPDDPFFGAVVSMGLMGIITSVTLQCVPAYYVVGSEATTFVKDCAYDFLGNGGKGKPGVVQFLSRTEFTRTMWWPFTSLNRVVVWQAKKMAKKGKVATTPYRSIFPSLGGTPMASEEFASMGFKLIATWPMWFYQLLGATPQQAPLIGLVQSMVEKAFPSVYPFLINLFMPINNADRPPKAFADRWNYALPMDRAEFSNNLFNLAYTEMWMPVEKAQIVLSTMQQLYTQKGYTATGFFTTEVFAAKQSPFWMSPAYQQNSVRINLLWFGAGIVDPTSYFQQFWDLLSPFHCRFHWGKTLPPADPKGKNVQSLKALYPQWDKWMALRNQLDPNQLFVSSYWRSQLGIKAKGK